MTIPTIRPGQAIGGRWTARSFLRGDGALATYVVAGGSGGEHVLKLLAPEITRRPDLMSTLQRIHVLQNELPGNACSRIVDAGIDATGAPFVVTDYLAAHALGRPSALMLGSIVTGLARTLDAAHARGLLHLALKPGNVLIGDAGQVKLTDFGVNVVRTVVQTHETFAHAAPWMAPEQLLGQPAGAAADIFSAALVTFHALTGGSFWSSVQSSNVDPQTFLQEIQDRRALASARAAALGCDLPAAVDSVFARALAANPSERYPSVEAFTTALVQALHLPSDVRPVSPRMLKQTAYAIGPLEQPTTSNALKQTSYALGPAVAQLLPELRKKSEPSAPPPPVDNFLAATVGPPDQPRHGLGGARHGDAGNSALDAALITAPSAAYADAFPPPRQAGPAQPPMLGLAQPPLAGHSQPPPAGHSQPPPVRPLSAPPPHQQPLPPTLSRGELPVLASEDSEAPPPPTGRGWVLPVVLLLVLLLGGGAAAAYFLAGPGSAAKVPPSASATVEDDEDEPVKPAASAKPSVEAPAPPVERTPPPVASEPPPPPPPSASQAEPPKPTTKPPVPTTTVVAPRPPVVPTAGDKKPCGKFVKCD